MSEPHTSARAFAGKPATFAGAGPRGKSRPGPCLWLYPCPRPLAGTRIIYDRKFLMECRNSPVTKTPPRDLPTIPGVTSPTGDEPPTEASQNHLRSSPEDKPAGGEWLGTAGLSLQEAEERAWGWVVQGARGSSCPVEQSRGRGKGLGCSTFIGTHFPQERGPGSPGKAIQPHQIVSLVGSLFERRWHPGGRFHKPLDNLYTIVPEAFLCVCSNLEHTQDVFVQEAAYQKHSVLAL